MRFRFRLDIKRAILVLMTITVLSLIAVKIGEQDQQEELPPETYITQ